MMRMTLTAHHRPAGRGELMSAHVAASAASTPAMAGPAAPAAFAIMGMLMFAAAVSGADLPSLESPDGSIQAKLSLQNGAVHYEVLYRHGELREQIIVPSPLGLTFKAGGSLRDLRLEAHEARERDETWRPVWGRAAEVRDNYRELTLMLREWAKPHRQVSVILRAYDDGLAFRYRIPHQFDVPSVNPSVPDVAPGMASFALISEDTEFRFAGDPMAWWIPADEFAYESLYRETRLSECSHISTPVTLRTGGGLWVSLHEAALLDYSEMTLKRTQGSWLRAHLWPWPDGEAVKGEAPFTTPWRTIMIAPRLGDLAESHLIQNLNEPCVIEDTSFIEPMTFIGIWWGMHTGLWTWHAGRRHGATTERAKEYIDFAARHEIGGVLVEGWNLGWETWGDGESLQDYLTPYPDFDLEDVAQHARDRGVRLIGHHETGGNVPMYEEQMEEAFALCRRLGITSVKTGYAGQIRPVGMHHHGQYMVRHFQRVVETAARHGLTLNVHEGIKPTGLDRTWPNLMCTEAVRGTEWNATLNTIPPRHSTVLPFTRFLAGPADVTPGIFHLNHAPERGRRVEATLANQLALYVVLHSPLMMLADLVEHYEGRPALAFLQHVPVTWDETRVLGAEMNRYAAFARRRGGEWYVGGVTDHDARLLEVPLCFLDPGRTYIADIYADSPHTDWENNPGAIVISRHAVTASDTLNAALSRAGGLAMRIVPADAEGRGGAIGHDEVRHGDAVEQVDVADHEISIGHQYTGRLPGLPGIEELNAAAPERLQRFTALRTPGDLRMSHLAVGAEVVLAHPPSPRYDQGALCDGRIAGAGFQDPAWLGFEGDDLEALLDLGDDRGLTELNLRILQDPVNWIMIPELVLVELSRDGDIFSEAGRIAPDADDDVVIRNIRFDLAGRSARYLRVTARQRPLPEGHPGRGKAGWIFCDEIEVR